MLRVARVKGLCIINFCTTIRGTEPHVTPFISLWILVSHWKKCVMFEWYEKCINVVGLSLTVLSNWYIYIAYILGQRWLVRSLSFLAMTMWFLKKKPLICLNKKCSVLLDLIPFGSVQKTLNSNLGF